MHGADRPATVDEARALLERAALPCRAVVVTLGADGASCKEAHATHTVHAPAPSADAVDTVGAVDTFCGALADALGRGTALPAAVERVVLAASHAATGLGAQTTMPYAAQLDPPAVVSAS
ncbi:PfkB family carbohydrate kinase [Streptomyces sp. NPDC056227]|uniref:PfkB family carbohydrate kinase n=1 Tax=Streptomyces sp. NPDC056227 TaxID=3345753 RepID=UPI0035D81031